MAPRGKEGPESDKPFSLARDGAADNLHFIFHGEHTLRLVFSRSDPTSAWQATLTISAKDYIDPANRPITNPVARSLHFDSRDLADKSPYGAVTSGSEVEYSLDALPGADAATLVIELRRLEGSQEVLDYRDIARVPLHKSRDGEREHWQGRYRYADIGVYGYYFLVEIDGKTYRYENNRDRIYWTREAGSNGLGAVSEVSASMRPVRHYRQTVYRADFRVPEWARDTVFYYIFPERFRNGDSRNDPKPGVDTYQNKPVEFHQNWLDKPYLPRSGDGSDDIYANDFFGGDIQGIIDKLDYIAQLGANALYINPLFRATSNHKYDTADYKHIDPHFGTDADFVRLWVRLPQREVFA